MSITVETGAGLSTADSYLSVADADTYHTNHDDPTAWSGATTAVKENALRIATQYLDVVYDGRWRGIRTKEAQALAWPRANADDNDWYTFDSNFMPQRLKDATAELALRHIATPLLADVDAGADAPLKSKKIKVGPIETDKEFMGGQDQYPRYRMVEYMIRPLLMSSNTVYRA